MPLVLNKYSSQESTLQPRIIVIQVKRDAAHTYNAVMNTVFRYIPHFVHDVHMKHHITIHLHCSAQKMHVPIDALVLSKNTSNFLQVSTLIDERRW
jgi:hypothetical protein